VENVLGSVNIF